MYRCHYGSKQKVNACKVSTLLLTHLCLMEFPTLMNWTSPFPILGLLDCNFHIYSNFKKKLLFANSR